MPIYEFKCPKGHVIEKILTFAQGESVVSVPCSHKKKSAGRLCGLDAERVEFSVPLPAHFYGDPEGYYKPSPTKRHSYKTSEKGGNDNSVG